MPTIPRRRELFTLAKIARGQSMTVTTGAPIILATTHFTQKGSRLCDANTPTGCQHCNDRVSARRVLAFVPIKTNEGRILLWVASGHALAGVQSTEELEGKTITITRARQNNLMKMTIDGPGPLFNAPTTSWAATFLGCEVSDVKEHQP